MLIQPPARNVPPTLARGRIQVRRELQLRRCVPDAFGNALGGYFAQELGSSGSQQEAQLKQQELAQIRREAENNSSPAPWARPIDILGGYRGGNDLPGDGAAGPVPDMKLNQYGLLMDQVEVMTDTGPMIRNAQGELSRALLPAEGELAAQVLPNVLN